MTSLEGYTLRALLFADMEKGGRMQVHEIMRGDVATGIKITTIKPSRLHGWSESIEMAGVEYESICKAIEAWEKAQ